MQTIGSQLNMPKNLPGHYLGWVLLHDKHEPSLNSYKEKLPRIHSQDFFQKMSLCGFWFGSSARG